MSNLRKGVEQFLVGRDIFGHVIGVNYRGSGTYKTRLGAFCTFSTLILTFFYFVTLITAFIDGSNQGENVDRLKY